MTDILKHLCGKADFAEELGYHDHASTIRDAIAEIERLRSTIPSADSRERQDIVEKINGMLRKLEALRIAFDMRGANATTILRVVNTLSTMKNAIAAALSHPPAQEGVETAAPAERLVVDVPCPCTLIEQDEDCPIGYPSMVCGICEGKGHTTQEQVTALACEMIKIASDVGEPEDPFAAWESISLIQSQNSQFRKVADEALQAMNRCEHDGGFDREIGPIGCNLGDKCVCLGIYPIIGRATSTPPYIEHKQGGEACGIADPSTRDCPNMKEVGGGMDGERYRCEVCGKGYYLDYEEMK